MRRGFILSAVALTLMTFASSLRAEELEIQVSPNIINIASKTSVVTVHTNIAYSKVNASETKLFIDASIPISWWKADNQGNFVAKFNANSVKGLIDLGANKSLMLTVDLKIVTKDGVSMTGSQEVKFINVVGKK